MEKALLPMERLCFGRVFFMGRISGASGEYGGMEPEDKQRLYGPDRPPLLTKKKNWVDPNTLLKEALCVWRIMVCIVVAELFGAMAGERWGHALTSLTRQWKGAGFAVPFGLLVGLAWHYAHPARRTREHWEIVLLICLIAIIAPIAAWLNPVGEFPESAFHERALQTPTHTGRPPLTSSSPPWFGSVCILLGIILAVSAPKIISGSDRWTELRYESWHLGERALVWACRWTKLWVYVGLIGACLGCLGFGIMVLLRH